MKFYRFLTYALVIAIIAGCYYGLFLIHSPSKYKFRQKLMGYLKKQDIRVFPMDELKNGGYVIFMRHTSREKDVWGNQVREIESLSLIDLKGECGPGSQLNEKGLIELDMLTKEIKKRNIPISEVYASPTCRTQQMAKIMFGDEFKTTEGLLYVYLRDPKRHKYYNDLLRDLVTKPVKDGQNRLLLSHNRLLIAKVANFPLSLKQGDAAIFKPAENKSGDLRLNFLGVMRNTEWLKK